MLARKDLRVLEYLEQAGQPLSPLDIKLPTAVDKYLKPGGKLWYLFSRWPPGSGFVLRSLYRLEAMGLVTATTLPTGLRLYQTVSVPEVPSAS
jgi:hypothetical protein